MKKLNILSWNSQGWSEEKSKFVSFNLKLGIATVACLQEVSSFTPSGLENGMFKINRVEWGIPQPVADELVEKLWEKAWVKANKETDDSMEEEVQKGEYAGQNNRCSIATVSLGKYT